MNTRAKHQLAGIVVCAVLATFWAPPANAYLPGVALSSYSARGVPSAGKALLGAASGNADQDPAAIETVLGTTLALHRTYWRGDQVDRAVRRAELDLRAGRLPWLSFKAPPAPGTSTPYSWEEMAAGAGDQWARDLGARLASLGGPVWVAVHHEPENDKGDLQSWTEMQRRLSPLLRAAPNVAFTVILMGWHQFVAPARNPALSMEALWPGPQYVDVTGFDPYNWYGTVNGVGRTNTTFTDLKVYYEHFTRWSRSVGGSKWAISETGLSDSAAVRDVAWISRAFSDLKAAGGVALAYYDRNGEMGSPFRLNGTKVTEFAKTLARSSRITDKPIPEGSIVGTDLGPGFAPAWITAKARTRSATLRWAKPAAVRPGTATRYRVYVARYIPSAEAWAKPYLACKVRAPKRSCVEKALKRGSKYRIRVDVQFSDGRLLVGPTTTSRTKG